MLRYPTVYRDRFGEIDTVIENDGCTLRMAVRGVTFSGSDFDGLAPEDPVPDDLQARFTLNQGDLCSCSIGCTIPITVHHGGLDLAAELHAQLELGDPTARGVLSYGSLTLRLRSPLGELCSTGKSGYFEDELLQLQARLPAGALLKACIGCAFSDYSPYGHGLFGGMACFRGCKEEYLSVRTKADLFDIWDRMAGFVQETYLCPDFQPRRPGAGYRG